MPCIQNCKSLSATAGFRCMIHVKKAVENTWTQHNYIDSNIAQYHSARCVIVSVVFAVCCVALHSSWHIHSRVMIV